MAAELKAFTFDPTHEKIGLRLTCKEGELPRIHKVIPESHAAKMGVVDGSVVVKIKYKTKDKKTVEVDMVGLPSDMMEQKIVAGMQERPITFYLRKPAAASASSPAKGGAPVERKDSGVSMSDLNRKLIELEERLKSEATARAATERENSAIKRDLEQARSRPTTPRADVEDGMAARLLPASYPSSSAVERPTPVRSGQRSPESMISGAFHGAFDPDYVPGLNWIKVRAQTRLRLRERLWLPSLLIESAADGPSEARSGLPPKSCKTHALLTLRWPPLASLTLLIASPLDTPLDSRWDPVAPSTCCSSSRSSTAAPNSSSRSSFSTRSSPSTLSIATPSR